MLICIVLFRERRFNTFMDMFSESDRNSYAWMWCVIYIHTYKETSINIYIYIYIYIYTHSDIYLLRHQSSFWAILTEILTNIKSQKITNVLTVLNQLHQFYSNLHTAYNMFLNCRSVCSIIGLAWNWSHSLCISLVPAVKLFTLSLHSLPSYNYMFSARSSHNDSSKYKIMPCP